MRKRKKMQLSKSVMKIIGQVHYHRQNRLTGTRCLPEPLKASNQDYMGERDLGSSVMKYFVNSLSASRWAALIAKTTVSLSALSTTLTI